MVQGLLLDGIDAEAAGAAVGREHHLVIETPADEAQTPLALPQLAEAVAQVALDALVFQPVPVAAGNDAGTSCDLHVHVIRLVWRSLYHRARAGGGRQRSRSRKSHS